MWNRSSKRLVCALQYAVSHDHITDSPIRYLYAELATSQKCNYGVVERSLRYAIGRMWECSTSECSKLLYHSNKAMHCPPVSEFILLYSNAFKRGTIQAWVDALEAEESETMNIDDILAMF